MNLAYSTQERRRDPRLKRNIPVKICSDAFDLVTETHNISRSGAYCHTSRYIEPMTKLRIHLLLPFKRSQRTVTKKVSCGGVIVRTESIPGRNGFNIAIYFNEIQSRDADCLQEYITSMLEGEISASL